MKHKAWNASRTQTGRLCQFAVLIVLSIWCTQAAWGEVRFPSGETAYIVADAGSTTNLQARITGHLVEYLSKVLGKPAQVVSRLDAVPAKASAIVLSAGGANAPFGITVPQKSPEPYTLQTRTEKAHAIVVAAGNTDTGLKRAVQRLVLKSEQRSPGLVIPDLQVAESPWMPRREWALCSWSPESVRGVFYNPYVDKRLNVWLYSNEQIARYVEMFDWFGFSGCQLLESCNSFADRGSPENFQSLLKTFAREARANGQDVSFWVWAAQFTGHGWNDSAVTYAPQAGMTAFDDPKVRAGFERYYNHYAEMAPYVDLLIAHFYDPGSLKNRADVFRYTHLLFDKFKAKNPKLQFGVDFWAVTSASEYMQQYVDNGLGDVLMLETTMPSYWPPGKRETLHEEARRRGIKLGVWGWYTAEVETDQNPMMHVNAQLLSHFYRQIRDGVDRIHPITYWSEMEAYHLNNIFTMYAASQLLWNPDRDPDEILREIAEGIWGPRNGPQILAALKLIQDTRTGPTWATYWRPLKTHRLGTPNPQDDLHRADQCIASLNEMTTDAAYVPKFPLPFPPATFVELVIPHLRQIRQFAETRVKIGEIREAANSGVSKEELTKLANSAWNPVRDYNTWIGVFGQLEAIEQETMLMQLAKDIGITITPPDWLRFRDTERLLQAIQSQQRSSSEPWRFKSRKSPLLSGAGFMLWPQEKLDDRLKLLVENGCVERTNEDTYQLVNWEEYSLQRPHVAP
jgi:hypothetical protein